MTTAPRRGEHLDRAFPSLSSLVATALGRQDDGLPDDRPAGDGLLDDGLRLTPHERNRMTHAGDVLHDSLMSGHDVYGVTSGFGPLVSYRAADDPADQGAGLIAHLCTGQGAPLSPAATALMVWLRLAGMRQGHSGVHPDTWEALATLHLHGCIPVVPGEGSLSASGDLVPLAHAARAFAGDGAFWRGTEHANAADVLAAADLRPLRWHARSALAFVNGSSASLAVTVLNHQELLAQARAVAALTGRIAHLLGCSQEPYGEPLSRVRNQPGQLRAAAWIRKELTPGRPRGDDRPLQEPYSLRCAPQVIGAVVDQLSYQEAVLLAEANGCTDNPVVVDDAVWHGGNFHALPVGLASDQLTLCAHQLTFLAERQLALLLDPHHNGGLPPMLTPHPGRGSGLAGVQIAATSLLAKIRQTAHPATLTPLPTNLGNQDHVPMALNGAVVGAECTRLGWTVIGSLALAVGQLQHAEGVPDGHAAFWHRLHTDFPPLREDRPLAGEVRTAARLVRDTFRDDPPTALSTTQPWAPTAGPSLAG